MHASLRPTTCDNQADFALQCVFLVVHDKYDIILYSRILLQEITFAVLGPRTIEKCKQNGIPIKIQKKIK